ncbi:hypothetical protein AOQ84DRAFT_435622 [Glonium stellatum]|uniref:Extracellular membrane protein CFEM domain-containing protein n=1 Tax=Glonium stellatum TaxID=574774 RepID=A0A8E2FC88_9PEZI|nr:hypothetical protein AOQ84DRAFT_435622 [Glonium stellatum]
MRTFNICQLIASVVVLAPYLVLADSSTSMGLMTSMATSFSCDTGAPLSCLTSWCPQFTPAVCGASYLFGEACSLASEPGPTFTQYSCPSTLAGYFSSDLASILSGIITGAVTATTTTVTSGSVTSTIITAPSNTSKSSASRAGATQGGPLSLVLSIGLVLAIGIGGLALLL